MRERLTIEKEGRPVWRWGKKEIIYLSLHCHYQNDSCIKMGSDESHFNVSLIVRDRVTRQYPQNTTFEEPLPTSLTLYRWAKPAHICPFALSRDELFIIMYQR